MFCWTRFCTSHFEATYVVRVVLTVEIPTLDCGGGVDYWVGGTEMFRSPQVEDRTEAEFLHKLDERSNG